MKRIVVACEDAGGARALAPVVRRLLDRGDAIDFMLGPVAARTFGELAAGARPITSVGEVPARLPQCDALLSTSTCWGLRLEARLVQAARAARAPTLTLIDFPSQLLERLSFPTKTDLGALPDLLAVPDDLTRDLLVAAGVALAHVAVTGSPALDEVLLSAPLEPSLSRTVLFLSQPLAALYGEELGYTERTVLAALAPVVAAAGLRLVVRPHPREDARELAAYVGALPVDARVEITGSLRDALREALVVVGMSTMALIESALHGVPTISAQLGRRGEEVLTSNRVGLTRLVTDASELPRAIAEERRPRAGLERLAHARALGWRPGATDRVLACLDGVFNLHR